MRRLLTKKDFTLGALYHLGAERRFDQATLVRLMVERVYLPLDRAKRLAGHWLTTEPYRRNLC